MFGPSSFQTLGSAASTPTYPRLRSFTAIPPRGGSGGLELEQAGGVPTLDLLLVLGAEAEFIQQLEAVHGVPPVPVVADDEVVGAHELDEVTAGPDVVDEDVEVE